jgi:hypothetical protein
MDSATFYVAYAPSHSAWEWGWDAWVAIGTLALAATTLLAVIVPLVAAYINGRKEETRLATLFDHELHLLCGIMVARAAATTDSYRTPDTCSDALQAIFYSHAKIGVPILEKLVDRLGVFKTKTAMDLGVVLTGVMQVQRNPPPEGFATGADVPYERALPSIAAVFEESVAIATFVQRARLAIHPKISRVVRMPPPRSLPQFITDARAEAMAEARARQ